MLGLAGRVAPKDMHSLKYPPLTGIEGNTHQLTQHERTIWTRFSQGKAVAYPLLIPLACAKEPDIVPVIAPRALSLLPLVSAFLESLIDCVETGLVIWVWVWLRGSHMSNRSRSTAASSSILCHTCRALAQHRVH